MKYIGAHVSAAGGVDKAPLNAARINAGGFALFTRNQRRWHSKPLDPEAIDGFKKNCRRHRFTPEQILAHDSYLINLGHPNKTALEKSRAAFLDEIRRCRQLGLNTLNFHPGSHLIKSPGKGAAGITACLRTIADSLNRALDQTDGVTLVIENTAGQGTNVGRSFEEIADIIHNVTDKSRIGVCIDTCHAWAAGYDLKTAQGYADTWQAFDRTIGRSFLKGLHLNDAKRDRGSRVDRHESLGKGFLGMEAFERIMTDPRFDGMPLILETPDNDRWKQEIACLRRAAANGRSSGNALAGESTDTETHRSASSDLLPD